MTRHMELRVKDINLKQLEYSPFDNPLVDKDINIPLKRIGVRSGILTKRNTIIAETGEILHEVSYHVKQKLVDESHFVKVYADKITQTYELSKAGQKVFTEVLKIYETEKLSPNGYLETVTLWVNDGHLNNEPLPFSAKTFSRGLKELLACNILAPKTPSSYWINPTVFFRGDRVLFVEEVIRRRGLVDERERLKLKERLAG